MLSFLDPRTKLVLSLAYASILVLTADWRGLLLESGLLVACIFALGLDRAWLSSLKLMLTMATVVFAISLFSFGLPTALAAGLRLLAMFSTFFSFFRTTAPEDLASSLIKVGLPYEFAFILTSSLRFVPVIRGKMENIADAQRARGIDLGGVRSYLALLAPLLVQSFAMADELAEAMESRGFGCRGRTFLREYRMGWQDYFFLLAAVLTLAALLIIR